MNKRILFFLVAVLASYFISTGTASAATAYYISAAGGTATRDGSVGHEWKASDIQSAYNVLNCGDTLLANRGDVYNYPGTGFSATKTGCGAGTPITFGTYGTGANPIFRGVRNPASGDSGSQVFIGARLNADYHIFNDWRIESFDVGVFTGNPSNYNPDYTSSTAEEGKNTGWQFNRGGTYYTRFSMDISGTTNAACGPLVTSCVVPVSGATSGWAWTDYTIYGMCREGIRLRNGVDGWTMTRFTANGGGATYDKCPGQTGVHWGTTSGGNDKTTPDRNGVMTDMWGTDFNERTDSGDRQGDFLTGEEESTGIIIRRGFATLSADSGIDVKGDTDVYDFVSYKNLHNFKSYASGTWNGITKQLRLHNVLGHSQQSNGGSQTGAQIKTFGTVVIDNSTFYENNQNSSDGFKIQTTFSSGSITKTNTIIGFDGSRGTGLSTVTIEADRTVNGQVRHGTYTDKDSGAYTYDGEGASQSGTNPAFNSKNTNYDGVNIKGTYWHPQAAGYLPAVGYREPNSVTPYTVGPPTGFSASAVSTSQINLSWQPSTGTESGIKNYKVYRNGTVIATMPAPTQSSSSVRRRFSPDSFYNKKLSVSEPLHSNSAGMVSELVRQTKVGPGIPWLPGINKGDFSSPIYIVTDPSTVKVPVTIVQGGSEATWSPFNSIAKKGVRVPTNALPATGSDGSLAIWDQIDDVYYDFWQLKKVNGAWQASWGGYIVDVSNSDGIIPVIKNVWGGPEAQGSTATSLPLMGGAIYLAELKAGVIPHALGFAIPQGPNKFVWPAMRTDGGVQYWEGPNALPAGTRFRFPANIVIDPNWAPIVKMIVTAIRDYGLVIQDRAGAVVLYIEDTRQYGSGDLTSQFFGGKYAYELMSQQFPWSKLQVLTVPSPAPRSPTPIDAPPIPTGGGSVNTSSTISFSDTGLSAGTSYSYQVSAVNTLNLESAKSSAVTVVTPVGNRAPTLTVQPTQSVAEGASLSFTVNGSDPDGNTIAYSATNLPTGATFNASTRTFSWTPTFAQAGNYTVTFIVSDGALQASQNVPITVTNVNRPPTFTGVGDKTISKGVLLSFVMTATDPDGDALTYSATNLPTGATFNASTRTFSWTPTLTQVGSYTVTFSVKDAVLTTTTNVVIAVVNNPPVFTAITSQTGNEGSPMSFAVSASDSDNDSLTYSATGLPQGAVFNGATRVFSWTPNSAQAGNHTVVFSVTDGVAKTDRSVLIVINDVSATPNAVVTKVYYVAISGSDSNSGTQANPWKTLAYAIPKLKAGETLFISAGVYKENSTALFVNSGTASTPIKVVGVGTVLLDGSLKKASSGSFAPVIDTVGKHYIRFENIGVAFSRGIQISGNSHDIVIDGLRGNNNEYVVVIRGGYNITVRNANVTRSYFAFRAEGDTHDVLMEDIVTSYAITPNIQDDGFQNGDGFIFESDTYNLTFRRIVSSYNGDAGLDIKGDNVRIENIISHHNTNGLKLWGTNVNVINTLIYDLVDQTSPTGRFTASVGINVRAGNIKVYNSTVAMNGGEVAGTTGNLNLGAIQCNCPQGQ
ncbi:MAG: putative Ig domain-containing protein, partial [Patescibacteria group bacterium]